MGWLAPQVWMFQGDLPITPQSLLVVLWGVLWGWRSGHASVVLYFVVGGMGCPCLPTVHTDGSTSREAQGLFLGLSHRGPRGRLVR